MRLKKCIKQFYYDMTMNELRLMNEFTTFPNITYNSLLYLDIMAYEEKCTVTQLAEALNISKAAVTIKVNEMIKMGLVTKTQSTDDKRVNFLAVSNQAMAEYEVYNRSLQRAIQKITEQFEPEKIDIFCDILQVISREYLIEGERYKNE